jgi:hypothetical protein
MFNFIQKIKDKKWDKREREEKFIFFVDKDQYPFDELIQFSVNVGAHIIIRKYAEIVNGEVRYMQ